MDRGVRFGAVVLLPVLLAACAGDGTGPGAGRLPYRTKVTEATTPAEQPSAAPTIVYVQDFELEVAPKADSQTILPGRGPVRSILGELRGDDQDPAERAHKMVNLMSTTLVEDLTEKGLRAERLLPGAPLPAEGWLVRGVVTELDEGNRVRKAVIGFGAGKSELTLNVGFVDLAKDASQPFYTFEASNNSGDMPGGAAMKMNPYAMAAKFVMSRNADDREVQHTAETIALQLTERLTSPAATPGGG